jgi:hypothetical protein
MTWRFWVACAAAVLVTGCGGGGGGSSAVRAPAVSGDYPGLANIATTTTLSTLADSAVVDTAVPSAALAGGATVSIDWSNTLIRIQVTNVGGQSFTQDFAGGSLNTITIGGVPFVGTLAPVPGSDPGSSVALLYTQVGLGTNSFDHTVLGRWTYQATIPATVDTVGFFVAGTETRQEDLPTTGTASYTGRLLANLYEAGVGTGTVVGNATGSANFGANAFTFSTSGSTLNGTADASLDVTGSLTRPAGVPASNAWTGTISTDATRSLNGSINGRCFGPACAEFGGTFFMNGTGQQMLGGILLKQ